MGLVCELDFSERESTWCMKHRMFMNKFEYSSQNNNLIECYLKISMTDIKQHFWGN